jgi:hypothetical protein
MKEARFAFEKMALKIFLCAEKCRSRCWSPVLFEQMTQSEHIELTMFGF